MVRNACWLALFVAAPSFAQDADGPVIDMHAHAYSVGFVAGANICPGDSGTHAPTVDPLDEFDPAIELSRCDNPIVASATDEALMNESIATMRRFNIRRAITSGDVADVAKWRAAAPDLIVPALGFGASIPVSVETLESLREKAPLTKSLAITASDGTGCWAVRN